MKYEIRDWANNLLFGGKQFLTFEDAWGHVYDAFPNEEEFDDYYVVPIK
jgi:hypothetical protein